MRDVEVLADRALGRWSAACWTPRTPPWWCRNAACGSGRRPCAPAPRRGRRHRRCSTRSRSWPRGPCRWRPPSSCGRRRGSGAWCRRCTWRREFASCRSGHQAARPRQDRAGNQQRRSGEAVALIGTCGTPTARRVERLLHALRDEEPAVVAGQALLLHLGAAGLELAAGSAFHLARIVLQLLAR